MNWYYITYANQQQARIKAIDFLSAVQWAVEYAAMINYRVVSVYEE